QLELQTVRVLPTARTEPLAELVHAVLGDGAELLDAVASEQRFALLAGAFDVVVCADRREPFERRALLAAASGAAAVHLPGGAAAHVLGDELAYDGPRSLRAALTASGSRAARAQLVRDQCAIEVIAPELAQLVENARAHA